MKVAIWCALNGSCFFLVFCVWMKEGHFHIWEIIKQPFYHCHAEQQTILFILYRYIYIAARTSAVKPQIHIVVQACYYSWKMTTHTFFLLLCLFIFCLVSWMYSYLFGHPLECLCCRCRPGTHGQLFIGMAIVFNQVSVQEPIILSFVQTILLVSDCIFTGKCWKPLHRVNLENPLNKQSKYSLYILLCCSAA